MSNEQPAYKATIGKVTVTVWRNPTQNGNVVHNIEFSRSYKDKDENWQSSTSFGHQDLLNLGKLAERAEGFIHQDK